jgi:hypothetical protein
MLVFVFMKWHWSRLPEPEPQLSKKPLALPDAERNMKFFLNPCRQSFSIPDINGEPMVSRTFSDGFADFVHLLGIQGAWSSRL